VHNNGVVIKVAPIAAYLAVLRTAVAGIAARDRFTLDQVEDLRMAVEEAANQLLHVSSGPIEMTVVPTDTGLEVRLFAEVNTADQVIDESSLSWMILRALADDLRVESAQSMSTIVLSKHRLTARDDV
jgi:serine/threonine-protein kinase RsbW